MIQDAIVDVLTETVRVLEAAAVPYAVTGSVGSSVIARP